MGLGLKIVLQNVRFLEMEDTSGFKLVFYKVENFAQTSKGYSPMLSYQVQGIENVVGEMLKHGAKQEGTITTAGNLKLALLQGINHEMINLYEGNLDETEKRQKEEEDAMISEVKQILKRLI